MAYVDLRAQLVSIITGTTPAASPFGWPAKYEEAVSVGRDGRVRRARAFSLLAADLSIYSAIAGRRMHQAQWTITFHLGPLPTDRRAFDLALQADRKALSDRIIDPANWSASTTGFVVLQPSGAETTLPFSLDVSDPEDVKDVLRVGVAYRS